ncbi:carbohydrate ABC transporter permease [Truepera radiovictrix]|uniref:Binding-protein-dependent transport systems inner membrane component n=1 Tax=Truepera radiovictrix (strain DSM 17093 / CIP 108686 / LMG 22925 / RQ-24) TaxID=649638 RepID=D7CVT0_TRURR|nr:carbohydrate ABC transporter permease [Truepera radiovictrix]ADI15991.1 binding-protein-dependent transport systems inner membrane component [Truepera radiovictrix DSM 17093]WMT58383.1 carbohydrate ABC transporter permease [Truepera radiovictrix]
MTAGRSKLGSALLSALTLLLAFAMFFPILWMFLTSFKTEQLAIQFPPPLFFEPTLENWRVALLNSPFMQYLRNTIVITFFAIVLALALGIPTAYAMAFYQTKRTDSSLLWMMSTRMLPPAGVIVPLYVIFLRTNLLDTHLGLIILYAGMNFPLVVWMLRSFMLEVPYEVIEAARLDGANLWQEFGRVILPLLIPGLAATALLAMIFTWNEFFLAVNLTARDASPLSVYVSTFKAAQGNLFIAKMSAAATAAVIPVLVAGWVAQRQLVTGLTMGAIK